MSTTTVSHYSQHALASLRRRPYHPHPRTTTPPSLLLRPRPSSIYASPVATPSQLSMIDFLRSQGEPARSPPRTLKVVEALRTPSSSRPVQDHRVKCNLGPQAKNMAAPPPAPSAAAAKRTSTSSISSTGKKRESAIASFFRSTFTEEAEVESNLRPLVLAASARCATPNPNRVRIRETPELITAATESRTVPIGGRRAAALRAKRLQWAESVARGERPTHSFDVDSEISCPSERVETPTDFVFYGRSAPRSSWGEDKVKA